MATRLGKVGVRTLAGALVAASPVAAACTLGPTYDQWAATDGAAGRINLDAVQDAFKKAGSASDFERRVNEIYEGDGLVLVRVKQEADATILEGWEDFKKDGVIDDGEDDQLFEIVERNKQHQMRGYGSNGHYNRGFGGGDFLFTYLVLSSLSRPGYHYTTSPGYARGTLNSQRKSYRGSSRCRSQVSRNSRYFNANKGGGFTGSRYSSARRSYQSTQKSTGAFKRSGTGVRSSWGASSRSGGARGGGRSGGFRGFGGGQRIIGPTRG